MPSMYGNSGNYLHTCTFYSNRNRKAQPKRKPNFILYITLQKSGLSAVMGTLFARLDFMSLYGIVMTFSAITAFMTEFASNSAVASVLLPISAQLVLPK